MADAFEGKVCIVTGGTSGIGLAISKGLLERGAVVYAVGFPQESVDAAKDELSGYENARPALVDVTQCEQVQGIVDRAVEENGRLDYMFNNAGMGGTMPFEMITLDDWKREVDLNLWGVIYGVHAAFHVMLKQGSGHIVNTGSIAGLMPPPYQAAYCATKYAVVGMTEALRYEHAYRGIHFSVPCPANVATSIFGDAPPPEDAISADEAAEHILAGVERKEGIIVFPDDWKENYLRWNPGQEVRDKQFLELAEQRRKAYETGGRYY